MFDELENIHRNACRAIFILGMALVRRKIGRGGLESARVLLEKAHMEMEELCNR